MAEACIGLALMVFAWIIISYCLYMGNNHISTAMAARYAAWSKGAAGENSTPSAATIEPLFFHQTGLMKLSYCKGVMPLQTITGGFSKDSGTGGNGPYMATVTYGITADEVSSTTRYPFSLLKVRVPYMTEDAVLSDYLKVESQCQWDEVGNTWTSLGEALTGLWNTLKDTVSSFF